MTCSEPSKTLGITGVQEILDICQAHDYRFIRKGNRPTGQEKGNEIMGQDINIQELTYSLGELTLAIRHAISGAKTYAALPHVTGEPVSFYLDGSVRLAVLEGADLEEKRANRDRLRAKIDELFGTGAQSYDQLQALISAVEAYKVALNLVKSRDNLGCRQSISRALTQLNGVVERTVNRVIGERERAADRAARDAAQRQSRIEFLTQLIAHNTENAQFVTKIRSNSYSWSFDVIDETIGYYAASGLEIYVRPTVVDDVAKLTFEVQDRGLFEGAANNWEWPDHNTTHTCDTYEEAQALIEQAVEIAKRHYVEVQIPHRKTEALVELNDLLSVGESVAA